jgi:hypothetical protein
MRIRFVGPQTGGMYLPGDIFVAHGATVDVDDELGADLCSRIDGDGPAWVAVPNPRDKKTEPTTTTGDDT